MYPVFICDDDPFFLDHIHNLITNYILFHESQYYSLVTTKDPQDIVLFLEHRPVVNGVYLLDIDLNDTSDINGIDLAEYIRERDKEAKIIFITSHESYARRTIQRKIEPFGFLVKSEFENLKTDLFELLKDAYYRLNYTVVSENQSMVINSDGVSYNIKFEDIYYCETTDVPHLIEYNIRINNDTKQILCYDSLNNIEKKSQPNLLRVSRNLIVNPSHISRIDKKNKNLWLKRQIKKSFSIKYQHRLKRVLPEFF